MRIWEYHLPKLTLGTYCRGIGEEKEVDDIEKEVAENAAFDSASERVDRSIDQASDEA